MDELNVDVTKDFQIGDYTMVLDGEWRGFLNQEGAMVRYKVTEYSGPTKEVKIPLDVAVQFALILLKEKDSLEV